MTTLPNTIRTVSAANLEALLSIKYKSINGIVVFESVFSVNFAISSHTVKENVEVISTT